MGNIKVGKICGEDIIESEMSGKIGRQSFLIYLYWRIVKENHTDGLRKKPVDTNMQKGKLNFCQIYRAIWLSKVRILE